MHKLRNIIYKHILWGTNLTKPCIFLKTFAWHTRILHISKTSSLESTTRTDETMKDMKTRHTNEYLFEWKAVVVK